MKSYTALALFSCLLTSGCVSMPDTALADRIRSDMASAPECARMFLAVPADCRVDRSLCVGGILSYQEEAQGPKNAVFAVFENEFGEVKGCSWNSAGFARGWEFLENAVLASCEQMSVSTMTKTGKKMKPCRIFARDNAVQ
jgi:hypothetical protein